MTLLRYALSRNVAATNSAGEERRICMVLIEHENGFKQRLVIDEEKIRFCGEAIIEHEVHEAAARGDSMGLTKGIG